LHCGATILADSDLCAVASHRDHLVETECTDAEKHSIHALIRAGDPWPTQTIRG
jgi:hypothetical protein